MINQYIKQWAKQILKESGELCEEMSNQEVLKQFQAIEKEPIIGYDKE